MSLISLTSSFNFYKKDSVIDLSKDRDAVIREIVKQLENPKTSLFGDDDECRNREHYQGPDFFKFFPSLKAVLKKEGDSAQFWNGCFDSNKIILEKLSKEETVLRITSNNASSKLCKDSYLITTSSIHQIEIKFFKGDSTYTFKNLTEDDIIEIQVGGFRVYSFCEDIAKTIVSIYQTIKLFTDKGSGILPYPINNEKEVMDFLRRYTDYKIEKRDPRYADNVVEIDESLIQTGDFLPLYQPCGLSSLIMFVSGSHVSHSTVAFRIDGELYVLESEENGVIRTKYRDWVNHYHEKGYMIAWLPLKDNYRKKFNVEKAFEWYKKREGTDYGFHNIIFAWYDSAKKNVPEYMDNEVLLLISSVVEKYDKSIVQKYFIQALNLRLNTKLSSIPELTVAAARQGLTFEELMALPEKDEWIYDNGENYVCSSLVIGIYKAAGLFDDLEINAKEFTPRDVYQLEFIDRDFKDKRPEACKQADPNLDFCQIAGKYEMNFIGVSTVKSYQRMNERCECVPPIYNRNDGC